MTLTELISAVLVFSLAATSSVRLWGTTAAWSQAAAAREALANGIEADLLRRSQQLRASVALQPPQPASCELAAGWLRSRLAVGVAALPQGVQMQLIQEGGSVWLVYVASAEGLERRRLFSAAANGLCPLAPTPPALTDTEVGA